MAFTLESYDFDRIRKDAGVEASDAIRGLWLALNEESRARRTAVNDLLLAWKKGVRRTSYGSNQNDAPTDDAAIQRFDGGTNITITGMRAGLEGQAMLLFVLGSGIVTIAHESTSSEANNRFQNGSGANLAINPNRAALYVYLNSRWRQQQWA